MQKLRNIPERSLPYEKQKILRKHVVYYKNKKGHQKPKVFYLKNA